MRIFLLLLFFGLIGCSEEAVPNADVSGPMVEGANASGHDMSMHDDGAMVLEGSAAELGDHSLYQVESTWTNQAGVSMQLASLKGKPIVVAMTYTSCEVSCPRIVSAMQHVLSDTKTDAGFVLISIDPERDTVDQLQEYASKMKLDASRWNLLTGVEDDVREMAALLGVRYQQMPDGEFAHSNIITVLDSDGVIYHQQNGIASDLTAETLAQLNLLSN